MLIRLALAEQESEQYLAHHRQSEPARNSVANVQNVDPLVQDTYNLREIRYWYGRYPGRQVNVHPSDAPLGISTACRFPPADISFDILGYRPSSIDY